MANADIHLPDNSGKIPLVLSDFPAAFEGRGAHIFACEVAHGPMPDGLLACHRCDVRRCVNPDHLFPGTHLENMQDMIAKGRHHHGEQRGKLTNEQVMAILNDKRKAIDIAKEYGVKPAVIGGILSGKTWRNIPRAGTRAEAEGLRKERLQSERLARMCKPKMAEEPLGPWAEDLLAVLNQVDFLGAPENTHETVEINGKRTFIYHGKRNKDGAKMAMVNIT